MNGGSAWLRILYEHASSVGPRSNSFSPIRRRAFFTEKLLALADECPLVATEPPITNHGNSTNSVEP